VTQLSLTKTDATGVKTDALIIGVARDGDGGLVLAPGAAEVDKAMKKQLVATLRALGATGKEGEVTKLATLGAVTAPTLVAVGLGDAAPRRGSYRHEVLRRAAGAATRALAGTPKVATTLAQAGDRTPEAVRAVAEGLALGAYAFTRYRSASTDSVKPPVASAAILTPSPRDKAARAAVERSAVVAEAVALCRDLVNTPAGDLHPADLADAAVAAARPVGLTVEVLDEKALAKGGFGGILGVGAGSAHPPRLVRISHKVRKPKLKVAIVGKGITFDSGGISLKPALGMEWMKSDMGGAAAVLSTLVAVARLGLDVDVDGWMPIAENMPSGSAIRPSDVLTMRGGKTVEVLNTDAEGRLILGDAIARACEEKPDVVIDVATLTGAQLVALGSLTFAIMANDDALRDSLGAAAGRAGELAWPMPLPPELRKSLDSEIADIANMGDRYGGMLVAGLFLKEFVAEGVRWAHLDVAGPAYNQGEPWGYTAKGGTGVPVRTLVELLESYAAG
jgi:leucyl aminopeptidase